VRIAISQCTKTTENYYSAIYSREEEEEKKCLRGYLELDHETRKKER